MTDFHAKLQQYTQMQQQMRDLLRQHGEQLVQAVFEEVFALDSDINVVCVRGYTPSWNDGDVCTHSSEMFTGALRDGYNGRQFRDYQDYDQSLKEVFVDEYQHFVNEDADNDNLRNAASLMWEFDGLIQDVYGTNYQLIVRRTANNAIVIEDEEYDCGY